MKWSKYNEDRWVHVGFLPSVERVAQGTNVQ
jgi:hypothetical protein